MPSTSRVDIKELFLDLNNFRTVPQKSEEEAVAALISIRPDRFFALAESLIDDGYILPENIVAIKSGDGNQLIVKEGNRRIAALKLIHNYLNPSEFELPENIIEKIRQISDNWKKENLTVPCDVYENTESKTVDKIVSLTHGKGDQASRDKWPSIATARHNRAINNASEPALDLLEKYFEKGKNITTHQKEQWPGDYPLTILVELLPKIANRIGESTASDVATKYPNVAYREQIEKVLSNIGVENIGFKHIRASDFFELNGFPPKSSNTSSNSSSSSTNTAQTSGTSPSNQNNQQSSNSSSQSGQSSSTGNSSNTSSSTSAGSSTNAGNSGYASATGSASSSDKAYAINDPRGVTKLLKSFKPSGLNRQKVVTLRDEALSLTLKKNPIAFCFLLRSMFEISAKAYFDDHKLSVQKNGKDKTLKEMLNEAKNHLTNQGQNAVLNKELHGAITELSKSAGILSVTSLNQLVHNPSFSVIEPDICTLFVQIFPLLKALN